MPKNSLNPITTSILVGFTSLLLSSCGGSSDSASNNSTPAPTPSNSDPLLAYQWHLLNLGTSAFSSTLPVKGFDINVMGAWALGYTGKGIKIGVVDSGLDVNHEDLAANVDVANSYNFVTNTNDPTPSVVGPDHGTEVAGIIGAVANNSKGGVGIAFNSRLRGYNSLALGGLSATSYSAAFGGATYSVDNDIFNGSFGDTNTLNTASQIYDSIFQNTGNLRNGKGAIVVRAAGNNFKALQTSPQGDPICNLANTLGVSCGDPATSYGLANYHSIVVGAFNARGVKSSYSSAGSALWISAPGGEGGVSNLYQQFPIFDSPPYKAPYTSYQPAIITTNLTGCNNAFSNQGVVISLNALDSDGESALARQCQYTAIMNGTSAATPMISGVAALMLEANPNLGYRDVKYILAKTAKRIDPTYSPVTYDYGGSRITLDSGWVQNAAGFWFSTWYGFGAVDATAAVIMAKTYINYLPPIVESGTVSVAQTAITVPYTANGSAVTFSVSASMKAVEHVQLYLSIPQAPTNGLMCNQVQLTSPSGTTSILMHAGTGFGSYSAVGSNATPQTSVSTAQLLSNAFYGESAAGVWGLQILDLCSSGTGTILPAGTAQVLTISGH